MVLILWAFVIVSMLPKSTNNNKNALLQYSRYISINENQIKEALRFSRDGLNIRRITKNISRPIDLLGL